MSSDQGKTDHSESLDKETDSAQERTDHVMASDQEATLDQETVSDQVQMVPEENLEGTEISEKSLENEDTDIFWLKLDGQKRLATENYVEGNQVYGEKLYKKAKIEYRVWDPYRSKLAAALYIGLDVFPITRGTKVLYLGASTGTTVSHISDIVGFDGLVFAVEHASRVARDFLDRVASFRKNVIPILQDARHPKQYFSVYGKIDVVYSDIAQPDQTEIAITNCKAFLKDGGYLFLVIKTRSIDVTQAPRKVIESETKKLQDDFTVIQSMGLEPYDKDHGLVVAKYHAGG
jgi:fibrillarin-like pre-rRNA processing protein